MVKNTIMKKKVVLPLIALFITIAGGLFYMAEDANAVDTLQGDKKLACEAMLCLISGESPAECSGALRRYFSIRARKWKDTFKARRNFLKLCPKAGSDNALVNAVVNGSGRCDAASLNRNKQWYGDEDGIEGIIDQMPRYCQDYYTHAYIQSEPPRYVGTPETEGYWVEAQDYAVAKAAYDRKQEQKRLARLAQQSEE